MQPKEGRLQTAEHILAKTIENKVRDAMVVIAKFKENSGLVEFSTERDLRELDRDELQAKVNETIKKKLAVGANNLNRQEALDFDLSKIPESVDKIRIIEIEGFDKRPCRDPHVQNTAKIGNFIIQKVKRAGKNRYRFVFSVE